MSLTGVELSDKTLENIKKNIKPNMVLVIISDDKGEPRVVEIDHQSIPKDEPFLKVTAGPVSATALVQDGCWKCIGGKVVWQSPCQ